MRDSKEYHRGAPWWDLTNMEMELTINGHKRSLESNRGDSLLDLLRRYGYTGAKRGCDTGDCGYCTVIVDGEAVQSCVTPTKTVEGARVETIESLGTQDDLHPVQEAFVDNSALQCGFCIPGMIMNTTAALRENPDPSKVESREAIEPVLCRCTGHKKPVEAVMDAADQIDSSTGLSQDSEENILETTDSGSERGTDE
jgi:carbon-monoxide dehydrogenase small subunit